MKTVRWVLCSAALPGPPKPSRLGSCGVREGPGELLPLMKRFLEHLLQISKGAISGPGTPPGGPDPRRGLLAPFRSCGHGHPQSASPRKGP